MDLPSSKGRRVAATCTRCGEQVATGAAFCPACGHPQHDAGGNASGKVRDLQERSGTSWFTKSEHTILSFRLAIFDDAGNLERLVPAELRGSSIAGALNENDEVTVSGRFRNGILRAKRIRNLTDGSEVTAEGIPLVAKAIAAVGFAGIGGFMVFVWYQLASGA
jgi:hypothetical protein